MSAATALIAGDDPRPELAAEAVEQALARAGLTHASGVLLLLTAAFARSAQAAVHAASRAGKCLQIAGGIAAGLANERSWVFDRPAAAALVLGEPFAFVADDAAASHLVGIAADTSLPLPWREPADRCGLLFQDPSLKDPFPAWQQGRLTADHRAAVGIAGARGHRAVSTGLRPIGPIHRVEAVTRFDLERLDGMKAVDVLRSELSPDDRPDAGAGSTALPLQHLCAVVGAERLGTVPRLLPVVAANGDGSLTLGERLSPGDRLGFAIRRPVDAENEFRARLDELSGACPTPDFGLFFSCIGRGPHFYGGDDRDWQLFRQRFPAMPFLGAYGNGQIAPVPEPRALKNCVVLNVFTA